MYLYPLGTQKLALSIQLTVLSIIYTHFDFCA